MKRVLLTLTLGLMVAFAAVACDKKEDTATEEAVEEAEAEETQAEEEVAEPAEEEAEEGAELAMVEVTAEGTKFDPPVKPEQLPEGVWYCDMGTVHYARTEEGDGKCAICGMVLKQKGGAAGEGDGAAEGEAEEGHEGHDH